MTHPLAEIDGHKKYIFSVAGEGFYLRVVTSAEEMEKREEAAELLARVMVEMQQDLQKKLAKEGQRLKITPLLEIPNWRETLPKKFGQEDNQTVFIVENERGEVASVMLISINDGKLRVNLEVGDDVGTFVYVDSVITAEKYKGCGVFSSAFDKVITMLANEKRGLEAPFEYVISMRAATAIRNSDDVEVDHMINLPLYAKMWEERFVDNQLQKRWCYGSGPGIARDKAPIADYSDEAKVDFMVKDEAAKAVREIPELEDGKKFSGIGSFLIGDLREDYSEVKGERVARMKAREARGVSKDADKKTTWEPDASPSDAAASGLMGRTDGRSGGSGSMSC